MNPGPIQNQSPLALQDHIPTLAAVLANRLRTVASRNHRREHNLGVVEWRILISLLRQPGVSAYRIGRDTDLNKAAVSRVLSELRGKGWVEINLKSPDSRTTVVSLTASGQALAHELMVQGRTRQELLLNVLDAQERRVLTSALQKLINHVPNWEAAAFGGKGPRASLKDSKNPAWSESGR